MHPQATSKVTIICTATKEGNWCTHRPRWPPSHNALHGHIRGVKKKADRDDGTHVYRINNTYTHTYTLGTTTNEPLDKEIKKGKKLSLT